MRKYENVCASSGLKYLSIHFKRSQSDTRNSDSSPVILNVFINFMSEENGEDGRKTQLIPSNITIDTFTVISPLLVDGATHKYCALSGYSTDERYRTKN